jgi:hypothetical protein
MQTGLDEIKKRLRNLSRTNLSTLKQNVFMI